MLFRSLEELDRFRDGLLAFAEEEAADLCRRIDRTGQLPGEDREELLALSRRFLEAFQADGRRGG